METIWWPAGSRISTAATASAGTAAEPETVGGPVGASLTGTTQLPAAVSVPSRVMTTMEQRFPAGMPVVVSATRTQPLAGVRFAAAVMSPLRMVNGDPGGLAVTAVGAAITTLG